MTTGRLVGLIVAIALTLGVRLVYWWLDKGKPHDPWRSTKRWGAVGVWLLGTVFILWANNFRVSAPVIFLILGLLAVQVAVINLWRTGINAVVEDEEYDDSTWGHPLGVRAELEREKKALLKAIKEAEFDREMGKLSKQDAEEMIGLYRARAIEVIKEIDKLGGGVGSIRDQIEREVKARLELEDKNRHASTVAASKASNVKAAKAAKKKKAPAAAAKDAADAAEKAASAAEKAAAAATAAASPTKEPGADEAADAAADAAASAAVEAKEAAAEAKEAAAEATPDPEDASASDSASDAASDSVAADEPPPTAAKASAKEATP